MQLHGSFALPVAKRIVKQILLALDFLHMTMERTHVGSSLFSSLPFSSLSFSRLRVSSCLSVCLSVAPDTDTKGPPVPHRRERAQHPSRPARTKGRAGGAHPGRPRREPPAHGLPLLPGHLPLVGPRGEHQSPLCAAAPVPRPRPLPGQPRDPAGPLRVRFVSPLSLPHLCCQFACRLVLVRVLELRFQTADRIRIRHAYESTPATWDTHQEMLAERAARAGSSDPDDSRSEEGTFRPFNELHAPLRLAAPEAIRGSPHPYSPPINVWAVGHLVSSAKRVVVVVAAAAYNGNSSSSSNSSLSLS